jgi:hypothetical protein
MKKLIALLLTIGIIGCSKPLDPVSYLVCVQEYQKDDKIYVMTDTMNEYVMVQFGNRFMEEWDIFDIIYSNVSVTDNLFQFNYEFMARQKTYPDAEITYKATWDAEVDRYLLTLKIDGTRSSFVEFEGKIKETPGEIYQDTLQCKQMDVDL